MLPVSLLQFFLWYQLLPLHFFPHQHCFCGINCSLPFFFLLALQPPMGVVFYSPLAGFSLLAYEFS